MDERDYRYLEELYQKYGYYEPPRRRWLTRILRSDKPTINYVLFVLTFLSTFFTGYLGNDNSIAAGFWYSGGIMTILLSHEMGHYLMCRKYGVKATLPFFIPFPFPLNPFGTMGAVIRMEGKMTSRKELFDIGAGGPLAGLVFTIPALYFGLRMSRIVPVELPQEGVLYLGESLLYKILSWFAVGSLPANYDTMLHPLAYAGWAGLFVTALNLLPVGQLDGGHVVYALFGENSKFIFPIFLGLFGLVCIFLYWGWILFLVLLLWFGFRHPPTIDPDTPLDPIRQTIAVIIFIIFVLSFTPVPFRLQ